MSRILPPAPVYYMKTDNPTFIVLFLNIHPQVYAGKSNCYEKSCNQLIINKLTFREKTKRNKEKE
jgi:hypothetical protein